MYRITRTIFVCKDGSIEQSNEIVEVNDLEKHRANLKGNKYAKIIASTIKVLIWPLFCFSW